MRSIPRELSDLDSIRIEDQSTFVAAANEDNRTSWLYYFPFLHGFAKGSTQTLLWEKSHGAVCLYYLKERETDYRLDLYLPPFPFSQNALRHGLQRARNFNRSRSSKIIWVEENQRDKISAEGFEMELIEEEYIYDGELLRDRAGPSFYRLRRNLSKTGRIEGLQILKYDKGHEEQCLQLLRSWRRFKENERSVRVTGRSYMRSCLLDALSFRSNLLIGEVILINDRLCGFAFGGQISRNYGSLFVALADHQVPGLGYLQRHHLMMTMQHLRYFNDSSDLGQSGLAEVKKSFNPVAMNAVYRARSTSRDSSRSAKSATAAFIEQV